MLKRRHDSRKSVRFFVEEDRGDSKLRLTGRLMLFMLLIAYLIQQVGLHTIVEL